MVRIKTFRDSVSYWDVERIVAEATRIVIKDSEIVDSTSSIERKTNIRAFHKGSWTYASTNRPELVDDLLERTCRAAISLGRYSKFAQEKYELAGGERGNEWKTPVKIDPESLSIDEKVERLLEIEKIARKVDPERIKTVANYSDSRSDVALTTSEGVDNLSQTITRCGMALTCIAKEGDRIQSMRDMSRGTCGYEIINEIDENKFSKEVAQKALALLKAKAAPGGKNTVVLDPLLVGTFIHEALGHLCEADHIVNDDDILAGHEGKIIGSELVSVVDDKRVERGFGSFGFDRDGIMGGNTKLIEKGKLVGLLNSRTSGGQMKQPSTGNCRGEFNQVRMSNTIFLGGDYSSVDEIIKETKKGVYLIDSSGGTTEPVNGYFNFGAMEGYLIENGKLAQHLRDVSILGNTLEILKAVDAVAKEVINHSGLCGKGGEWVPVGSSGPAIRTQAMIGGVT